MRLLLDTHAFLWFVLGDPRLSAQARRAIEDRANQRYLSLASAWEMAIKVSLGKLTVLHASKPFADDLIDKLSTNDVVLLQIDLPIVSHLSNLPFHQRDPFDRLLVAQCLTGNLTLVSIDTAFDDYGVSRIW